MSRYDLYSVRYPLLPLKNVVIFPRNVVTLLVGRARSIQAVEEALATDRRVVVTAQRDVQQDEPLAEHLYTVGTMGEIVQVERQQGGNVQVVLEGLSRAQLVAVTDVHIWKLLRRDQGLDREQAELALRELIAGLSGVSGGGMPRGGTDEHR